MNNPRTRSFHFFLFTLCFALFGSGCWPNVLDTADIAPANDDDASDDDDATDASDDDDSVVLPDDDDDDASDDDDLVSGEPEGAPCFGREQTSVNFDCDVIPDEYDIFNTDPNEPRVAWHDSVAPDGDNIRHVGFGYGDKTEHNGWHYENGRAVVYAGNWVIAEVAPGYYRGNILDENGNWGQFGDYCENGVWIDDDWFRDPSCLYDAGCPAENIPPGWAMAFKGTTEYTRRLTEGEMDDIPLAEDTCPTIQ